MDGEVRVETMAWEDAERRPSAGRFTGDEVLLLLAGDIATGGTKEEERQLSKGLNGAGASEVATERRSPASPNGRQPDHRTVVKCVG